jgi:deoxyribodipyrimidine photo-lyase
VWFRQDLRLADNPALDAACRRGPIVPVFIWAPTREEEGDWPPGGASRWWLHHALKSLDESLRRIGSSLIIRRGPSLEALWQLVRETGARAVVWNRRYEPAAIERDKIVKAALRLDGIEVESFNASLLWEPWEVLKKDGTPFKVFTPFWRNAMEMPEPAAPLPAPGFIVPSQLPGSEPLDSLELLPKIPWDTGLRQTWNPSETSAHLRLAHFLDAAVKTYGPDRDRPDLDGTSTMSPHLHHGTISPRQIWHTTVPVIRQMERSDPATKEPRDSAWHFLREVGWREFGYHLLYHFPHTPTQPLNERFKAFPWADGPAAMAQLHAWQRGRTGYPLIDAGMRQLWHTGWMHNRVRMVVGSFLVKDLLLSWSHGAAWFWDTLVDADLASNTLGWQWVGGCGADAAPYFRVFNPMGQGEKFDPSGAYVRRWVPELANLSDKWIHRPWEAPPMELAAAGVELGVTYPKPLVDHGQARDRALEAFSRIKTS